MKKIMMAVMAAFFYAVSMPASAFFCANCGEEFTQIINMIQLVASYVEQAEQTVSQAKMVEYQMKMITQAGGLTQSNLADALLSMKNVVNQGNAIGASSQRVANSFSQYSGPSNNYADNYKNWSRTTDDSVKASAAAYGLYMDREATTADTINQLQEMNNGADGTLKAAQIGNAISIKLTEQMQNLNGLVGAQSQAQNSWLAQQSQMQQQRAAIKFDAGRSVSMPK